MHVRLSVFSRSLRRYSTDALVRGKRVALDDIAPTPTLIEKTPKGQPSRPRKTIQELARERAEARMARERELAAKHDSDAPAPAPAPTERPSIANKSAADIKAITVQRRALRLKLQQTYAADSPFPETQEQAREARVKVPRGPSKTREELMAMAALRREERLKREETQAQSAPDRPRQRRRQQPQRQTKPPQNRPHDRLLLLEDAEEEAMSEEQLSQLIVDPTRNLGLHGQNYSPAVTGYPKFEGPEQLSPLGFDTFARPVKVMTPSKAVDIPLANAHGFSNGDYSSFVTVPDDSFSNSPTTLSPLELANRSLSHQQHISLEQRKQIVHTVEKATHAPATPAGQVSQPRSSLPKATARA